MVLSSEGVPVCLGLMICRAIHGCRTVASPSWALSLRIQMLLLASGDASLVGTGFDMDFYRLRSDKQERERMPCDTHCSGALLPSNAHVYL